MIEFEVAGLKYRSEKLDVKKQLHIARRLTPFIGALGAAFAGSSRTSLLSFLKTTLGQPSQEGVTDNPLPDVDIKEDDIQGMSIVLQTVMTAVSKLTDEDTDYIVDTCLSVVKRETVGNHWAPLTASNNALMFQDIEAPDLMRIVYKVLQDNIGRFTKARLLK